jgi:hypothetical protein
MLKVQTVEAERTRGAFCNPVTKWHFMITTGSRCKGMVSKHKYTCPIRAIEAGERMKNKLLGLTP